MGISLYMVHNDETKKTFWTDDREIFFSKKVI